MTSFAAKAAKDNFGLLLDTAQREPVTIEKKHRRVAVVLSIAEYERLEALEEAYWAAKADSALKDGLLGVNESAKVMERLRRKNA
jgi:prevent-host-death family protein